MLIPPKNNILSIDNNQNCFLHSKSFSCWNYIWKY